MDLTFNESMYGLDEMDTATESFDNYDFAMESEDGGDIKKTSLFQRIMNWFANMWEKLKAKVAKIKEAAAKSKVGQALAKFKTAWNQAKAAKSAEELQKCYEQGQSYAGDIAVAARDAYKQGKKEGSQQGFQHGKEQGKKEGNEEGFLNGYDQGRRHGYRRGKMAGMDEGVKKGTADGAKFGYDMGYSQGKEEGYHEGNRKGQMQGRYEQAKKANNVSEKMREKTNEQIVADKAADQKAENKRNLEVQKKKLEIKIRQAEMRAARAKSQKAKAAALREAAQFRRAINGLVSTAKESAVDSLEAEEIAIEAAFAEYFGINHIGVESVVDNALSAMESNTEISCLDVDTCAETIVGLESQIEQFNRDVNALKIASENYLVDGDLETRVAASKLPAKRLHQACVDLGIASESFGEKDIQNLHDFLMGANDIMIDRANDLIRYGALEEFGYTADDEDSEIATESDLYDMDDLDAMESALDLELEMNTPDGTEDDDAEAATESFEGESVNFLNSLVNESYLDYKDEDVAEEGLKEVAGKVARAGKSVLNAILNAIDKLVEKFRNLRAKILANKALKSPMIPDIVLQDYNKLMGVLENVQNLDDLGDNSLYKGFMGETNYAGGNYKSVKGDIKIVLGGIQKATTVLSGLQAQIRKEQNAENVDEKFVEECQTALKRYKYAYRINVRYLEFAARKSWVSK